MKVFFDHNWFAPSETAHEGKLNQASGQRFKKGLREVPDTLRHLLPRSSKIVDDAAPVPAIDPEKGEVLRDFDELRAASDAEVKAVEAADKAQLELDVVVKRGPGRPRKEARVE